MSITRGSVPVPAEQRGQVYATAKGYGIRWYEAGARRRQAGFSSRSEARAWYRDVESKRMLQALRQCLEAGVRWGDMDSAGLPPRRIYDLRSTFASQALAAGVSVFELARIMGTSVRMIERHYGTLLQGTGDAIRSKLDAYLNRLGQERATEIEAVEAP